MTPALALIVCLAAHLDKCKTVFPEMDEGLSCAIQGQIVAAQWLADHPKWLLKGWKCGPVEKET